MFFHPLGKHNFLSPDCSGLTVPHPWVEMTTLWRLRDLCNHSYNNKHSVKFREWLWSCRKKTKQKKKVDFWLKTGNQLWSLALKSLTYGFTSTSCLCRRRESKTSTLLTKYFHTLPKSFNRSHSQLSRWDILGSTFMHYRALPSNYISTLEWLYRGK